MASPNDEPNGGPPSGWTEEESDDDLRSWLGPEDRVICRAEGDGWVAYTQPRDELGAAHQVDLTDGPVAREEAVETARGYMERNGE
ncbi:hypothetical protein [Halegenticoccus soli]|uniref:hypothetical protein n=1 Tax=Halegenticoccus soli TaxID=1985678 RepID=UPI000C6D06D5|nr:hypothetical protein [Halegenticoccus soli]